MTPASIDIVMPTYNRSGLLEKAVRSVFAADIPAGLAVRVIAVDNNSRDDTAAVVARLASEHPVTYLLETAQGSSHARNAGVAASTAELVAFIDDDEQLDPDWFREVLRAFADPGVDFVSGAYLPDWEAPPPDWLPTARYPAVVGWIESSPVVRDFGGWPGMLMGGNAVFRRGVLEAVGGLDPAFGRVGHGFGTGEDRALHLALLRAGKRGQYRPGLKIRHWIPVARMRKRYYVRWVFGNSQSTAVQDRAKRGRVPFLLGHPRTVFSTAAEGLAKALFGRFAGVSPADRFGGWLDAVDLAGRSYGLYRSGRRDAS